MKNKRISIVAAVATALVTSSVGADEGPQTRSYDKIIMVNATPEQAWNAFATGEGIEHWFAPEARVAPGVGGSVSVSWLNEYTFESPIAIWRPNEQIRVLWDEGGAAIEPGSFGYDVFITSKDAGTQIQLVHFGFPMTPEGDAMFEQISRGWDFELEVLRTALNDHAGQDRTVVYSRARLHDISVEDAWERAFAPGGLIEDAKLSDAKSGDRFNATFGRFTIEGTVRSCTPGKELIVDITSLGGAVLRLSTEPCIVDEGNVLSLWIDIWGQDAAVASEIHVDAQNHLATMFGEDRLMPPLADAR